MCFTDDHVEISVNIFLEENRESVWKLFFSSGERFGDLLWGNMDSWKGTKATLDWAGNRDPGIRTVQQEQASTALLW